MRIRAFTHADAEALLDLSLRAWEPVLPSIEQAFGAELYRLLTPDWRTEKRDEIAQFIGPGKRFDAWVAEVNQAPIGFVAIELHHDTHIGEIYLLAVDPDHQQQGIGTALIEFAFDWMTQRGMLTAMVETGFDPGHAPARRTYENAGFVAVPAARYFKKL